MNNKDSVSGEGVEGLGRFLMDLSSLALALPSDSQTGINDHKSLPVSLPRAIPF